MRFVLELISRKMMLCYNRSINSPVCVQTTKISTSHSRQTCDQQPKADCLFWGKMWPLFVIWLFLSATFSLICLVFNLLVDSPFSAFIFLFPPDQKEEGEIRSLKQVWRSFIMFMTTFCMKIASWARLYSLLHVVSSRK